MMKGTEVATVKIQEGVSLAEHSNYRIGGPARFFCEAANEEEIRAGVMADAMMIPPELGPFSVAKPS